MEQDWFRTIYYGVCLVMHVFVPKIWKCGICLSNVDFQPHYYILSQIPDSTVAYDPCMDVAWQ